MEFRKRDKSGELSTQQLVTIIILIISFVVIIFLIWRLNLGEETQKEICHNSVVLIGKGSGFVGNLDCKTNYVCISGGDECEGFSYDSKIKIDMTKQDPGKEIIDAIQKEVDDCWWMFGEGKIDYLKISEKGPLGKTNCAVCSVIKFDKKIQDKYTQMQFENQLSTENKLLISTSEKYSIVTGVKSNVGFGVGSKELFIGPDIVKSGEINSQLKCDEFISKS